MSKCPEHAILSQTSDLFMQSNLLDLPKFGFRAGHSSETFPPECCRCSESWKSCIGCFFHYPTGLLFSCQHNTASNRSGRSFQSSWGEEGTSGNNWCTPRLWSWSPSSFSLHSFSKAPSSSHVASRTTPMTSNCTWPSLLVTSQPGWGIISSRWSSTRPSCHDIVSVKVC